MTTMSSAWTNIWWEFDTHDSCKIYNSIGVTIIISIIIIIIITIIDIIIIITIYMLHIATTDIIADHFCYCGYVNVISH